VRAGRLVGGQVRPEPEALTLVDCPSALEGGLAGLALESLGLAEQVIDSAVDLVGHRGGDLEVLADVGPAQQHQGDHPVPPRLVGQGPVVGGRGGVRGQGDPDPERDQGERRSVTHGRASLLGWTLGVAARETGRAGAGGPRWPPTPARYTTAARIREAQTRASQLPPRLSRRLLRAAGLVVVASAGAGVAGAAGLAAVAAG